MENRKRRKDSIDRFPLGDEAAELVCGATMKHLVVRHQDDAVIPEQKDFVAEPDRPAPPTLFGALALLEAMKRSRTWRIGRTVTAPWRLLKKSLGLPYDDIHGG